jgi:hypothetical protein
MRTYYDVLGVAADTPDVVIKAAFRALAKDFHPDRAQAEAGDTDKFIEIQTAYSVLSKPQSRSEYDAELREASFIHSSLAETGGETPGTLVPRPSQSNPYNAGDIERIGARLGLYSEAMAHSFHEACLRGECGDDPWQFAEDMEKSFFQQYFSDDADVQALAKLLLLGSHTGAALTLNQLIARDANSPAKDVSGALAAILDQHFQDDTLFTEWLRVKFGILPAVTERVEGTVSLDLMPDQGKAAAATVAVPQMALHPPHGLRSASLVIVWAIALYFGLFAAMP